MRKYYKHLIVLSSIAIYARFVGWYVLVLLFLSLITICSSKYASKWGLYMPSSCLIVGFIAMKYCFPQSQIYLPIGYSVFAFNCLSFIVDNRQSNKKGNIMPLDVLCYLFFFPKMLCGPVVRFDEFSSQLNNVSFPNAVQLYKVFKIIVYASFSKFCIADNLSLLISADNFGINAWLASVLFAIQLYLDFYAYSNLAIAFSLLLGIELPISFNAPYQSSSFHDFWHRWNITISEWLKDYVYIPLGGNRCQKKYRNAMNVFVTFLFSGLWHGVSIPFILWGALHGLCYTFERMVDPFLQKHVSAKAVYLIVMYFFIILLWQLFRLNSIEDLTYLTYCLSTYAPVDVRLGIYLVLAVAIMAILDTLYVKNLIFSVKDGQQYIYKEVSLVSILLFMLILFHSHSQINFFYFKF